MYDAKFVLSSESICTHKECTRFNTTIKWMTRNKTNHFRSPSIWHTKPFIFDRLSLFLTKLNVNLNCNYFTLNCFEFHDIFSVVHRLTFPLDWMPQNFTRNSTLIKIAQNCNEPRPNVYIKKIPFMEFNSFVDIVLTPFSLCLIHTAHLLFAYSFRCTTQ